MTFTPPPSIQGLSTEDAYRKLDEEILQLEMRLSSVRTLRNSLAPICKFPNEILSKIFVHTHEYDGSAFEEDIDLSTRFVISWICRHWRDVALSCAELWTVIIGDDNPESVDFVQTLFNRSRNLPLSIHLHSSTVDIFEACMPHMSRVQELKVVDPPKVNITEELLLRSSPILTSLELEEISFRPISVMEIQPRRVHRLVVTNLVFTIAVPFITPSLTVLHLRGSFILFNTNHFFSILPSLLNLTELILDEALGHIHLPANRISLPSLQIFRILELNYTLIFNTLKVFDIPQAIITVSWPVDGGTMAASDWHDFWTGFHGYLRESRIPHPIRHISVQLDTPDYTLSLSSSNSPLQHHHVFEFPGQILDDDDDDDDDITFRFLHIAIPLDDLESLEINDIPKYTLPKLSELLNLKSVTVSGEDAPWQFMEAIDIEDAVGSWDANPKIPFKAIKELTIHATELQDENGPALENILENRFKAGFGLEKLVLVKCEDVEVELFEKFVKVVEVVE